MMGIASVSIIILFLLLSFIGTGMPAGSTTSSNGETEQSLSLLLEENLQLVRLSRALLSESKSFYSKINININKSSILRHSHSGQNTKQVFDDVRVGVALRDCVMLYEEAHSRMEQLIMDTEKMVFENNNKIIEDGRTWVSAAMTNHRTCLDGLKSNITTAFVLLSDDRVEAAARNLTMLLSNSLALYAKITTSSSEGSSNNSIRSRAAAPIPDDQYYRGILKSWDPRSSKADIVVARDGSGQYRTIRDAVAGLSSKSRSRSRERGRVIVYVKAGVYNEKMEIKRGLNNVMFVGDGIGKTLVTGSRNYVDGDTTVSSATFAVFGDGFWARDMTFENTAGPSKHQAVALMVSSDHSLFYRCSFRAYQDTLYAHSLRQFYRDCQIYGTVDFIFGNAAAVFQNCDIIVRRPMRGQSNMVTAQGRDNPNENTGFSIHASRILPDRDFIRDSAAPLRTNTYLGRPWKRYSRVVIWVTALDRMVNPKGWTEWEGNFALSTLFYAEYMNTGGGAPTGQRVTWPGFHFLKNINDVLPFNVINFIQGQQWIPGSGVPVWLNN